MKNILLILMIVMMSCKGDNSSPISSKTIMNDDLVDINFLIDFFEIDPLHRDKTMLERGYVLGEAWNYSGFEKGGIFSVSKNYEFAYYDEANDNWVAFVTNKPKTILSILNSIEENKSIKKIGTSKYSTGKYNIESSKADLHGKEVYLTILRRNEERTQTESDK